MGERIPATSEKVYSFEGYFNIKETYSSVKRYLEDSKFYDLTEKEYVEKTSGGKKEIVGKIEGVKTYNDEYQIVIKFEVNMSGKEEEIKVNEKVTKMHKGTAKIIVNTYVEVDWLGVRDKNPTHNFLAKVYDKFIGKDERKAVMIEAARDAGDLITRFKEHMNATIK